jgi:tetratricopeptide (TPR) repeat protein
MADVQDFYLDDTAASLRTWRTLLEAAERGQVAESALAEANAHLGIASQLDQLSRGPAALDHLHAVINARPAAPFAAIARAQLQLGQTLEHLGRHAEASTAYRAAIASAGRNDPLEIAARASTSLRAIEPSSRSTTTQ